MRKIIFVFCFLLAAFANSMAQQVIAAAGETFSNENMSISWTLGEVVIDTYVGDNMIVTQGFHQPGYIVTAIESFEYRKFEISLYPVPANDILHIDIAGERKFDLNYTITDLAGKIIRTGIIEKDNANHQVDVSGLATGNYYLRVYRKDGKQQSTYQIQKIR